MAINPTSDANTSLILSYISLEKETLDHYNISVKFSILQSSIVTNDYSFVRARFFNSVYNSENENSSPYVSQPQNISNPAEQALYAEVNQQQSANQAFKSLIASADLSLQDKIDPLAQPYLKLGIPPEAIRNLYKQTKVLTPLQQSNDIVQNTIVNTNPKNIILELMSKYRIDPFNIHQTNLNPLNLVESLKSYYTKNAILGISPASSYQIQKFELKVKDRIYLTLNCSLPKSQNNTTGNITLHFSLFKSNSNSPIYWTTKEFSIPEIKSFQSIQEAYPPQATIIDDNLYVTQKDPNSDSVKILRKIISRNGNTTNYTQFQDLSLKHQQQAKVKIPELISNLSVFRLKSYNSISTIENPSLESLITGGLSEFDNCCLIVTDNPASSNSVILTVTSIPSTVGQISISRSQKITGNSFGPEVIVSPFARVTIGSFETTDNSVQVDQSYRYTVYYKTLGGLVKKSIFQDHHFVNSAATSGISTNISEITVSEQDGNPSVSFLVTTQIVQNEATKVLKLLQSLGISQVFAGNINQIQSQFTDLLHHKIIRTNLNNGVKEIFEDISPDGNESSSVRFFDNSESQKKFSISSIDPSSKYRYEVRVFLRDPSTLNSKLTKEVNVNANGINRTIYYRPYKWRQPIVLSQGTLLAHDSEGQIIGRSLNDFGDVGTTAIYNLSSISDIYGISNLICQRIDLKTVKVKWNSLGEDVNYDHFVVVKESHKKKKIILTTLLTEFFYKLEKEDRGTVLFYVIPVLKDFSIGTAAKTNSIIVDPEEMDGYSSE